MPEDVAREKITLPDYTTNIELDEKGVSKPLDLLAGYMDDSGVLHKTFTIRCINGLDEKEISKPALRKGGRWMSILMERCVQSIGSIKKSSLTPDKWSKLMRKLYQGDQDIIFMRLQELSIGDVMELAVTCPECGAQLNTKYHLSDLKVIPFGGDTEIPFTLSMGYRDEAGNIHKNGFLRLPTVEDKEKLLPHADNDAEATTIMLARLCRFADDCPIDYYVIEALSMRDRLDLQTVFKNNLFGVDSDVHVTCPNCGANFVGNAASNFI